MISIKDQNEKEISLGDYVYKPYTSGRSAYVDLRVVTRIENGKLYLDDSKVPIQCPERLVITKDRP